MTESQLDRVAPWRKAYRELPPGLTTLELALLMTIERRGMRDAQRLVAGHTRPDVGWSVRDDGQPDSRRELAAIVGLGPTSTAKLNAAIDGLVCLRRVVVADDGAIGLVGWSEGQEPPAHATPVRSPSSSSSTERVRRFRARKRGRNADETAPGDGETPGETREETRGNARNAGETPHWGDRGGQRAEDRGHKTGLVVVTAGARAPAQPMTPGQRLSLARRQAATPTTERRLASRVGLDAADIRAFEADERAPTRGELEAIARELGDPELLSIKLPERDETVVETVVRAEAAARGLLALAQALGHWPSDDEAAGAEPRPVARTAAEAMRLVYAPGEGAQTLSNWLIVIPRMLEECRRQFEQKGSSSSAEYLRLEYLVKPKHRGRLRVDKDLDERRDCTPQPTRGRAAAPPRNAPVKPKVTYAE